MREDRNKPERQAEFQRAGGVARGQQSDEENAVDVLEEKSRLAEGKLSFNVLDEDETRMTHEG